MKMTIITPIPFADISADILDTLLVFSYWYVIYPGTKNMELACPNLLLLVLI